MPKEFEIKVYCPICMGDHNVLVDIETSIIVNGCEHVKGCLITDVDIHAFIDDRTEPSNSMAGE